MNRIISLFAVLALCIVASISNADQRPNIMVFLVDDMGIMDTSVAFLTDDEGKPQRYPLNDFYRTPSMERLAKQGIRFNQFYAMSVCSPTRISIMTGQNAARHHTTNWINPDQNNAGPLGPPAWDWEGLGKSDVTLPRQLAENGYRTIHVGKGHFGANDHEGAEPLNLGFEVNIAGAAFGAPGSYYGQDDYGHGGKRANHAVPHLEAYHGTETFLTEALTTEAKKRVTESVDEGRPFYLYFSHYAVHGPHQSDPRFAANYVDSGKPKGGQAFATLIEGMDHSLGKMLDHFEQLEIAENTLVIFLGDNGSDAPLGHQHEVACAAPLRGKKGAHYEGGMRVPFIAAWAKPNRDNVVQAQLAIPQGRIQSQVAAVQDIFPTILQVAGVNAPETHTVDGIGLQKLFSGESDLSRPEQFLMHYPHAPHRSNYFTVWRDGDWKVIYHALPKIGSKGGRRQSGGAHYQLFNLADDPFESTDLAETHPQDLERMMAGLIESMKHHKALYPVDDQGKEFRPELPSVANAQ